MLRVAIFEERENLREILVGQINRCPKLTCLAVCATADEALRKIPRLKLETVLVSMPPQDAIRVLEQVRDSGPTPPLGRLSKREREILTRLARGYPYKQIADDLNLSLHTVRQHIKSIYRKLRVRSRTEAVVKYLRARRRT